MRRRGRSRTSPPPPRECPPDRGRCGRAWATNLLHRAPRRFHATSRRATAYALQDFPGQSGADTAMGIPPLTQYAAGYRRGPWEVDDRITRPSPRDGRCNPRRMRIAVDFPAPFGPRNPKMLPDGTASESPARAVVLPYNFQTFFRTIGSAASGINLQTPGN